MPFNTLGYFLFLPVVFLAHYFSPDRFRWLVLLIASFVFYAALKATHLIAVLLVVTTITYFIAIWIYQPKNHTARTYFLWGGISLNVLTLIILKYLSFISQNLNSILNFFLPGITVPVSKTFVAIGVSYFIFQAISYLVDIYLEVEKPEKHFGYFALYMSFFPKLLQGPIERDCDLLPELKNKYEFNYDNMRFGLMLFTWGLFKKVVIADRLGLYVDAVYENVHAFTGLPLLLSTYAYAFQVYMDFSGYTDMALGSARLFNINLTQNFNSPYLARSVADFWRRWHITFSRWILDYVFTPLQIQWRNAKRWGTAAALIVTFLISGVWHGASWGFVIWGGLHGLYMACSVFYKPYQKKLHKALGIEKTNLLKYLQIFVTFNLVSFAWVFFRATNLNDAVYVISNWFYVSGGLQSDFLLLQGISGLAILTASMMAVLLFNELLTKDKIKANQFVRYVIYAALILSCMNLGIPNEPKFIYFGF